MGVLLPVPARLVHSPCSTSSTPTLCLLPTVPCLHPVSLFLIPSCSGFASVFSALSIQSEVHRPTASVSPGARWTCGTLPPPQAPPGVTEACCSEPLTAGRAILCRDHSGRVGTIRQSLVAVHTSMLLTLLPLGHLRWLFCLVSPGSVGSGCVTWA